MNLSLTLKRFIRTTKRFVKVHKNDILFAGGVVTEVAAVVVTAKATLKNKEFVDECAVEMEQYTTTDEDTEEIIEAKADGRRSVNRKVVIGTVKNYAIPAALTVTSVLCYGKSHLNLKKDLAVTSAALAAEHAMNERLRRELNPEAPKEETEETKQECANPYSGGNPSDVDDYIIENGYLVMDSDFYYNAERDGYAMPTRIFLSPTTIAFQKDPYSDWQGNIDLNLDTISRLMKNLSREASLYGFINLNEIRKQFAKGLSVKIPAAENYYIAYDDTRARDSQIYYRVYGRAEYDQARNEWALDDTTLYIDILNMVCCPTEEKLNNAKRVAIQTNPLKEV